MPTASTAGRALITGASAGIGLAFAELLALSGTLPANPLPHRAVYAGAKSFLLTFTQALAGEVQADGVAVQVCLPGLVATEFHDTMPAAAKARFATMSMSASDVVQASL